MTETSAVVTLCPTYIEDYATAGTPVPNTVMKVIKEDGSLCSAGEHGEICARGPQVSLYSISIISPVLLLSFSKNEIYR